MREPAWTAGPWFVCSRPTDDGLAVIEDGRQHGLFPITCEWNEAPLIAAAPDLAAYVRSHAETDPKIATLIAKWDAAASNELSGEPCEHGWDRRICAMRGCGDDPMEIAQELIDLLRAETDPRAAELWAQITRASDGPT